MSRKSFRIALGIVAATLVVGACVLWYVLDRALDYPNQPRAGAGAEIEVTIDRGMSFPAIAALLAESGVVDRPRWFRLYAMQRGVTTKVKHGTYTLRDDLAPREVLDVLIEGVQEVTVPVTVPEGLHFLEVFAILDAAGVADATELEVLCRDRGFLDERGIQGLTCEGYLFPETYRFELPTQPVDVLDRLIDQFRTEWDRVRREHAEDVAEIKRELGWTDHQLLVLASIVEKEAVVPSEQARIAQVFINRLTSPAFVPHRLDTDPTIRYGCTIPLEKSAGCQGWNVTDRLRRAQLDDADNPYNTYQHEGLPPGPIANPGRGALEAAVDPDGSRFFFFVSRNDGTHVFSRTRAEHDRAVNQFQR